MLLRIVLPHRNELHRSSNSIFIETSMIHTFVTTVASCCTLKQGDKKRMFNGRLRVNYSKQCCKKRLWCQRFLTRSSKFSRWVRTGAHAKTRLTVTTCGCLSESACCISLSSERWCGFKTEKTKKANKVAPLGWLVTAQTHFAIQQQQEKQNSGI